MPRRRVRGARSLNLRHKQTGDSNASLHVDAGKNRAARAQASVGEGIVSSPRRFALRGRSHRCRLTSRRRFLHLAKRAVTESRSGKASSHRVLAAVAIRPASCRPGGPGPQQLPHDLAQFDFGFAPSEPPPEKSGQKPWQLRSVFPPGFSPTQPPARQRSRTISIEIPVTYHRFVENQDASGRR